MAFKEKKRTIDIHGIKCPVDPDFRIMCDLTEKDRTVLSRFYFAGLPEGVAVDEAIQGMLDFYKEGLAPGTAVETQEDKKGKALPCFDFAEDEGYFYAAFLSEYGIDLYTAKLHWFVFCDLFRGLPDDCRLKQIIGIRNTKMSDVPKYDKRRMAKLKRIYSLDKNRERRFATVEERDRDMLERVNRRYAEISNKE